MNYYVFIVSEPRILLLFSRKINQQQFGRSKWRVWSTFIHWWTGKIEKIVITSLLVNHLWGSAVRKANSWACEHVSGPVQTPLQSCAEPNWWIKYGERTVSELIWYGSFSLVRQKPQLRTFVELNLGSKHVAPVSLQSGVSYSIRFGTWKVRRLNQASVNLSSVMWP